MAATLTEPQKRDFCNVVQLGCSRDTACKFIGIALAELSAVMESDPGLAQLVNQAEARAEVLYMGHVHKAAQDEKNWRTSVWWLDRRAREAASAADATMEELLIAVRAALEKFAEIIVAELPGAERRQTILAQLLVIADEAANDREVETRTPLPVPEAPAALPSGGEGEG